MLKSLFITIFSICMLMGYAQTDGYAPSSDGVKIHYKLYGKGAPILLINGGAGYSSRHLEGFAAELSGHGYQVILFDRRGTGLSTLPKADTTTVTMDKMVGDLEALRTHLKLEKWTVLGYSFGGTYGMFYSVKHSDKLNGLLLTSPAGIDVSFAYYYQQNQMARLSVAELTELEKLAGVNTKEAEERRLDLTVRAYVYSPKHLAEVNKLFHNSQYYPEIDGLIIKDILKLQYNLVPQFKKFKKPCLILFGRQDFLGDGTALKTHQGIPNSKLVFINECNHYPWIEQKETYFKEVDAFMKSLEAKK
jgi:proline iminopeptidase